MENRRPYQISTDQSFGTRRTNSATCTKAPVYFQGTYPKFDRGIKSDASVSSKTNRSAYFVRNTDWSISTICGTTGSVIPPSVQCPGT